MTANATPPATPGADPFASVPIPPQASTTGNNAATNSNNQLANIQASQLAAQVANWAAQLEFAKERFRLLELPQYQSQSQLAIDQLAFQKASTAWQQAFQEASVTGTYQGQPTAQWLTQQAQLTGVLNGNETIQGKLNDAQINQMNANMQLAMKNQDLQERQFGFQQTQWNAEFGLQQAAQQMQYSGYMANGDPTLARQSIEGTQAQQYLSLLGSLRGPANAFAQARVIGNTPDSMRSVAAAWLGKYNIGATTGSGQNPTPISGANMMGGAGGTGVAGTGAASGVPGLAPPTGITAGGYEAAAPGTVPTSSPYQQPVTTYPTLPAYQPPAAAAPAAGPTPFTATPANDGQPIPGRGFNPATWDDATRNAAAAWNAAHPGFQANGSQGGYGYVGPVPPNGGTFDFNNVPGRGIPPAQWNDATRAAVTAWNTAHPGYTANGSQSGYTFAGSAEAGGDPNAVVAPGATPPASGPGVGTQPTTGVGTQPPATAAAPPTGAPGQPSQTPTPPVHSPDTVAAGAATQSTEQTPAPAAAPAAPVTAVGAPVATTFSAATTPMAAAQSAQVQSAAGETATFSPPGVAASPADWNYTPSANGGYTVHPPGTTADAAQPQMSSNTPASADDLSDWFSTVQPNQINARNYNNMNTYNQQLGWAALEDQGWDIGAAQDAFKKSLPRYGGPSTGSFAGLG